MFIYQQPWKERERDQNIINTKVKKCCYACPIRMLDGDKIAVWATLLFEQAHTQVHHVDNF